MKLTQDEIFKLGFAYGSFSCGEIDQGIHIVLPGTLHESDEVVNEVFKVLFEKYFDRVFSRTNQMYMNAIVRFVKDNRLTIHIEEG